MEVNFGHINTLLDRLQRMQPKMYTFAVVLDMRVKLNNVSFCSKTAKELIISNIQNKCNKHYGSSFKYFMESNADRLCLSNVAIIHV